MKKALSIILGVVCVLTTFLTVITFKSTANEPFNDDRQILTVWQIDSFEGGVGSRTSFLKKVCNSYTTKNPNALFLVSAHTVESVKKLIERGQYPDLISYGACGIDIGSRALEIKGFNEVNDGGAPIKKRYAISWCRGNYFHIKRGNGGELILSENLYNSSLASATYNGVFKDNYLVLEPLTAYRSFTAKKNVEMIGTGRDIVRLTNRKIDFTATALSGYNDLYQYISITSNTNEKIAVANAFIKYLLSEEVQKKLTEINMLSSVIKGLYADEYFSLAEKCNFTVTAKFYQTEEEINDIKQNALAFFKNRSSEDFIKSLK